MANAVAIPTLFSLPCLVAGHLEFKFKILPFSHLLYGGLALSVIFLNIKANYTITNIFSK